MSAQCDNALEISDFCDFQLKDHYFSKTLLKSNVNMKVTIRRAEGETLPEFSKNLKVQGSSDIKELLNFIAECTELDRKIVHSGAFEPVDHIEMCLSMTFNGLELNADALELTKKQSESI